MSPKIADMSVDELLEMLRATIREVVEEVVDERLGDLIDPDEGLEMREDFAESLREFLASDQKTYDSDEVFRSLGLE